MNILVDSGDYKCSNMGDVAMLQVANARLRALFPAARIQILTSNPEHLARFCLDAEPAPQRGLQEWFADRYVLGRVHDLLPRATSRQLVRMKDVLRRRWPAFVGSLIGAGTWLKGGSGLDLRSFLESVYRADLIVICGQGGINDEFCGHAMAVLNFLDLALRLGKPVAMLGQGIGPMSDAALLARAKAVLPRVDLIALRESRAGLPLLLSLGVSPKRVVTTGDDAIELAFEARMAQAGTAIGVNVRAARHNCITEDEIEQIRLVIQGAAKKHNVPLVPVPIARHPDCKDARDIQLLLKAYDDLSDGGRELDTPLKVIKQVGRCRLVVTAAYHAAVFALAQGIPVVCLAKSTYVKDKFLGLADLFGVGCEILFLDEPGLANRLAAVFERAWESADQARIPLLEAAARQIEMSCSVGKMLGELSGDARAAA